MESPEAFEFLLAEMNAAIDASLARSAAATKSGDRDGMEAEAERQRNLVDARDQILNLQALWPKLVGEPRPSRNREPQPRLSQARARAPKGSITARDVYVIPILMALEEMGESGDSAEVIRRVGGLLAAQLTEQDRRPLKSGDIRWENYARWARQDMKQRGLLSDHSPVGVWEMTERGRAYLREHAGEASKLRARKA